MTRDTAGQWDKERERERAIKWMKWLMNKNPEQNYTHDTLHSVRPHATTPASPKLCFCQVFILTCFILDSSNCLNWTNRNIDIMWYDEHHLFMRRSRFVRFWGFVRPANAKKAWLCPTGFLGDVTPEGCTFFSDFLSFHWNTIKSLSFTSDRDFNDFFFFFNQYFIEF